MKSDFVALLEARIDTVVDLRELTLHIIGLEVYELVLNIAHGEESLCFILYFVDKTALRLIRVLIGKRRACKCERTIKVHLVPQLVHS